MQVRAYLMLKDWEPAKKDGFVLGYLKVYDKESKTDWSAGTTFALDPTTFGDAAQYYVMELSLREGKFGMQATITSFQLESSRRKSE